MCPPGEAAQKQEWGWGGWGNGKAVSFTCETGITCVPSSGLAIRSDQTDARPVMGLARHSGQLLHQDLGGGMKPRVAWKMRPLSRGD